MTVYPDRDELAREMFIRDNKRQSREASLDDWHELTAAMGGNTYTHHLADVALELFKAANPKPKGGALPGPPPAAGAIAVQLSGHSITDQIKDALAAGFPHQVQGQIARQ